METVRGCHPASVVLEKVGRPSANPAMAFRDTKRGLSGALDMLSEKQTWSQEVGVELGLQRKKHLDPPGELVGKQ